MIRTLCINTYAGSLMIGANAIKDDRHIDGSFEDSGFGAKIVYANRASFDQASDDFTQANVYKDWPDWDLTDYIVLAHPPCAAFSQQNTSKAKRGTETDAFECTRKVLKYAMNANAAGIAVESVMGAMAGAWDVHEHLAEAGGYHLYRILKNSILFGVPQFRERFWCVFVRKGLANPALRLRLAPRFTTVESTLSVLAHRGTPVDDGALDRQMARYVKLLCEGPCRCGEHLDPPRDVIHGFPHEEIWSLGYPPRLEGHKREGFTARISPKFFPKEDPRAVCRIHVSPFTSAQPSNLAMGGFAPVLLGGSLWIYKGQALTNEQYKLIMGFPADYVFPPDRTHGVRTYLSKGVCPPVATWVLDCVRQHLGEAQGSPLTNAGAYDKVCLPGKIVSFRPSKSAVVAKYADMWRWGSPEDDEPIELRGDDEGDEEDQD